MKLKEIQNGSLYYNKQRKRVERVISNNISNSRVFTDIEVSKYLNGKRGFFGRLSELFCL